MTAPAAPKPAEINPLLKLALDLGPLLLFFFANARWGIFAATGAFMAATEFARRASASAYGRSCVARCQRNHSASAERVAARWAASSSR